VQNNFIKKRLVTKSRLFNCVLFNVTASRPYNRAGMHLFCISSKMTLTYDILYSC